MGGDGVEQFLRYAIWVGVEKTDPEEAVDFRKFGQKLSQTVAQAKIFAIGSSVLPDKGNFAATGSGEIFCLADDGFKAAAAEFAAKLGNDAEGARVIAPFSDFD